MWSLVVVQSSLHQGHYDFREGLCAEQEHATPLDNFIQTQGKTKMWTHPKDSLFTSQWVPSPGPEEDVWLPTGHNGVWISGVELHSQDHFISGLKQHQSEPE